ncbi:hypothetical protein LTR86_008287 [Recurvomyces mirabilis]|nr:hypothetical protein LTR86_008287 [Recurvomyces mirabilis]
MSIIPRDSPLNLQYRICIVTSASSVLGIVVCKTLLKANALVLGIDDQKQDHSLSSAPGTHFQFLQCSIESASEQVVKVVAEKFEGSERVDVLICLGHGHGESALAETVGGFMCKGDGGSIVHILEHRKGMDEARRLVTSSHSQGKEVPNASEEAKQAAQKIYDAANLTLFLASDMSQNIDGKVVYADGMIDEI